MPLTTAEFRAHLPTVLSDPALQVLLDAAEADIVRRLGAASSRLERHETEGRYIFPARPVSTVASITETVGSTVTTLSGGDYRVWPGGYVIERVVASTNASGWWRGTIALTYAPAGDVAIRKRVQLKLVELDIANKPGLTGQAIGSWSETYGSNSVFNYAVERELILGTLSSGFVLA